MEDTDQTSNLDETREDIRMQTIKNEIDADLTCEVPVGEDEVCGNQQDPENGILVGYRPDSDVAECNVCLEEWFQTNTALATRESQVFALKILGRTHSQIADLLKNRFGDDGPAQETVSSHSRRAREKYFRSVRTAIELAPIYDPNEDYDDEPENESETETEDEDEQAIDANA